MKRGKNKFVRRVFDGMIERGSVSRPPVKWIHRVSKYWRELEVAGLSVLRRCQNRERCRPSATAIPRREVPMREQGVRYKLIDRSLKNGFVHLLSGVLI